MNVRIPIYLSIALCLGCGSDTAKSKKDCQAPTGPRITLKMGALEPGSGSSANEKWIQAIHMARDEMNAALACNPDSKNIQIEIIEHNDGNDASIVPELVDEMLEQGILALFTDTSGVSGAANGLNYDSSNPRGIPIVCSPCTHPSFNASTGSVKSKPSPGPDFSDEQWEKGMRDPDNWLRRTSITGDPDLGLAQRILYARGDNGDLNGDGIVKVAFYTAGQSCQENLLIRHMDDPSRFRCESVLGPSADDDSNTWTTWHEEAEMLLDRYNSSPEGTGYPSELVAESAFLDREVNGKPFSSYFTIDEEGGTIVTAENLPTDGYPDFVFNYLAPTHSLGSLQAINRVDPEVTIQAKNSFVRASTLILVGDQAEGVEGLANLLYSRDKSGRTFAENFEKTTKAQVAGFDASVYDAVVAAMLGILKAALPLKDPASVSRTDVNAALDEINDKSGETVGVGENEFSRAITILASGGAIDFAGASGPVDFDTDGNIVENLEFYKVKDGRWTTQYIFDCVSDPATCPTIDCKLEPDKCE